MNFLKNLIKGDYGLGKTFWVYGTLYQLIFSLIIFITFFFALDSIDKSLINYSQNPELIIKQIFSNISNFFATILVIELAILLIYTLIITVAMWRSASNNKNWFWPRVVKVSIALSVVYYLYKLIIFLELFG